MTIYLKCQPGPINSFHDKLKPTAKAVNEASGIYAWRGKKKIKPEKKKSTQEKKRKKEKENIYGGGRETL